MTRTTALATGLVVVLVVAIGGYLLYDNVLRGDAAAPLALPSAGATAPSAAAAASGDTSAAQSADPVASTDPTAGASSGTGSASGDVAGTWTVATGSLAGYRVREQLANLPAELDAVGRTDEVTGSITLSGSGDAVQLTDGLTHRRHDHRSPRTEPMRDNRLRSEGLQTDQYPTATFKLTRRSTSRPRPSPARPATSPSSAT